MFKILVVEDDRELNQQVCTYLKQNGYEAVGCLNANDAFNTMYNDLFDLLVSDIMMPGMDGFEFARAVRENSREMPILFMTARDDFAAKREGFRIGIDDYMVKPVDLEELVLRIGALLRRAGIATSHKLEVGALTLDADERSAVLHGEEIPLHITRFFPRYRMLDREPTEKAALLNLVDIARQQLKYVFPGNI